MPVRSRTSLLHKYVCRRAGEVRTLTSLDRETEPYYWLTVCAQDHGLVPRHACVQLHVDVLDDNDMRPWPDRPAYVAHVPERAPPATPVVTLAAVDDDAAGAPLSYRIAAGNPDGLFSIDESSGAIRTTGRVLDREATDAISLDVRVSDGELECAARVLVVLDDVNDHAPTFLEPFYSVRVPPAPRPQRDAASGDGADDADNELDDDPDDDPDADSDSDADDDSDELWEESDGPPADRDELYVATVSTTHHRIALSIARVLQGLNRIRFLMPWSDTLCESH